MVRSDWDWAPEFVWSPITSHILKGEKILPFRATSLGGFSPLFSKFHA